MRAVERRAHQAVADEAVEPSPSPSGTDARKSSQRGEGTVMSALNGRRGALAGIRVIDLSHQAAGPWCTSLLGDLGADVIKVEKPGRGDGIRYADRTGRLPPEIGGLNFQGLNRNKRGITIDIGTEAG